MAGDWTLEHEHTAGFEDDHEDRTSAGPAPAQEGGSARADRVTLERHEIWVGTTIAGYIEAVPPVLVAYVGAPFAAAVEVAQVFDFDEAIARIIAAR